MKGISLAEECQVVNVLPSVAATSATESDWFHLKESAHASIIIATGAVTNASTFTLREATSSAGSGSTAIVFDYYATSTAGSDTYSTKTRATAGGVSTGTTNNLTWILEVDSSQLSDGSAYLSLLFSTAATIQIGAISVMSGRRYQEDVGLSAID
tara:strand:+ start:695 stop:1159 length:465 start_codon:yes stop_codon:yes gene_type:complete